jgi:hypothetical protein
MSPETKQEEIIGQDNVGAEGTGAEVIKSQAILRPDLALLRECEFPLPQDEARMPSVNFNHGFVDISIITLDNPELLIIKLPLFLYGRRDALLSQIRIHREMVLIV